MTSNAPRALVCLLPGLGDALIASPMLRALAANGYALDALTMLRPVTEYARALQAFERVHELQLLANPTAILALAKLRRYRYALVCVPAPAARWQYAATAWLTGGKLTLIHAYGGLSSIIARIGGMREVRLRGGHRAAENARLIESLGMTCSDLRYLVPDAWKAPVKRPNLLGLHTGSMSYKGNEQKRWPLERFAEIARRHLEKGFPVRAFFGPNEPGESERFKALAPGIEIVERPLEQAALLLSECAVVLANDSGLAHLSAGLGVSTLVLFGMTDPTRCKPLGPAVVLRPSACPPCFDEGSRRFECVRNLQYRCLNEDLTTEFVARELDRTLAGDRIAASVPEMEGPFALYGRVRA